MTGQTARESAWRPLCEVNAEMTREDLTADQATDLRDQIADAIKQVDVMDGMASLDDEEAGSVTDAVMPIVIAIIKAERDELEDICGIYRRVRAYANTVTLERDQLKATIERVRRRHRQAEDSPCCHGCGFTWPCQTLRDIDQTEAG